MKRHNLFILTLCYITYTAATRKVACYDLEILKYGKNFIRRRQCSQRRSKKPWWVPCEFHEKENDRESLYIYINNYTHTQTHVLEKKKKNYKYINIYAYINIYRNILIEEGKEIFAITLRPFFYMGSSLHL